VIKKYGIWSLPILGFFLLFMTIYAVKNKPEPQQINLSYQSVNFYNDFAFLTETIIANVKLDRGKAAEHALYILIAANKYGIDYRYIYALARSEVENFDSEFHRVNDGYGVMQVLMGTAEQVGGGQMEVGALKRLDSNYDIGVRFFGSCLILKKHNLNEAVLMYKRWTNIDDKLDKAKLKHYYNYLGEIIDLKKQKQMLGAVYNGK